MEEHICGQQKAIVGQGLCSLPYITDTRQVCGVILLLESQLEQDRAGSFGPTCNECFFKTFFFPS